MHTFRSFIAPAAAALTARHKAFALVAAVIWISAANVVGGQTDQAGLPGERRAAYAIGLWGDLPYSPEQATVGVPNLVADMNAQKLAFTAHDGDLKAGGGRCDDQIYLDSLAYFSALEAPVIFTPGDNDWVDCERLLSLMIRRSGVKATFTGSSTPSRGRSVFSACSPTGQRR